MKGKQQSETEGWLSIRSGKEQLVNYAKQVRVYVELSYKAVQERWNLLNS